MVELIVALGLVFVIEGVLYALFPSAMKNMMKLAIGQNDQSIRIIGLVAAFIGVAIIYLIK